MTISLFPSSNVMSWLKSRFIVSRQMSSVSAQAPPLEPRVEDVVEDVVEPASLITLADIDFSETGDCRHLLLDGWSHQERDFIWAVDQTSDVALPDTQGWFDVRLELDLFPCILPPGHTVQRLQLHAGEVEIGSVEMRASGCVTIAAPPAVDWGQLRRLTLVHPDGIVPSELTDSSDGRCLSIAVRRITFRGRRMHAQDEIEAWAQPVSPPEPRALAPGERLSDTELILQFEALGGTWQGCEFGLVQREFGAEPLGLLRWTHMNAETLASALEADFEGVGTPEQTILDYFEWPSGREYRTEDRRFLMSMHTWVKEEEKPYDEMFKMICQRLVFLRAKLLEDLADSSKIFVFKMGDQICTTEQITRIHSALRRHGPNTLFYVRAADDAHPSGSVEAVQDGLLIGYIAQFNEGPEGVVRKPEYESWRKLCREAHGLWRKQAVLF